MPVGALLHQIGRSHDPAPPWQPYYGTYIWEDASAATVLAVSGDIILILAGAAVMVTAELEHSALIRKIRARRAAAAAKTTKQATCSSKKHTEEQTSAHEKKAITKDKASRSKASAKRTPAVRKLPHDAIPEPIQAATAKTDSSTTVAKRLQAVEEAQCKKRQGVAAGAIAVTEVLESATQAAEVAMEELMEATEVVQAAKEVKVQEETGVVRHVEGQELRHSRLSLWLKGDEALSDTDCDVSSDWGSSESESSRGDDAGVRSDAEEAEKEEEKKAEEARAAAAAAAVAAADAGADWAHVHQLMELLQADGAKDKSAAYAEGRSQLAALLGAPPQRLEPQPPRGWAEATRDRKHVGVIGQPVSAS